MLARSFAELFSCVPRIDVDLPASPSSTRPAGLPSPGEPESSGALVAAVVGAVVEARIVRDFAEHGIAAAGPAVGAAAADAAPQPVVGAGEAGAGDIDI